MRNTSFGLLAAISVSLSLGVLVLVHALGAAETRMAKRHVDGKGRPVLVKNGGPSQCWKIGSEVSLPPGTSHANSVMWQSCGFFSVGSPANGPGRWLTARLPRLAGMDDREGRS